MPRFHTSHPLSHRNCATPPPETHSYIRCNNIYSFVLLIWVCSTVTLVLMKFQRARAIFVASKGKAVETVRVHGDTVSCTCDSSLRKWRKEMDCFTATSVAYVTWNVDVDDSWRSSEGKQKNRHVLNSAVDIRFTCFLIVRLQKRR